MAWLGGLGPMRAQSTAPHQRTVHLLDARFTAEAALATAGSLVLLPVDGRVRSWMQASARQDSRLMHDWADVATPLGSSVPIVAAVGMYGVGRLAHDSVLADVGLHVTEAIGAAGATTLVLKMLVGRARPYVGAHDPHAFGQGRLIDFDSRYESFPSGHATLAFAMAAGATAEISEHWPGKQWVVGPLLYGVAASVAFARMYDDKHWASDVTAGAVVGTLVGDRVVHAVHTGGGWILTKLDPILLYLPGRGTVVGMRYAFR